MSEEKTQIDASVIEVQSLRDKREMRVILHNKEYKMKILLDYPAILTVFEQILGMFGREVLDDAMAITSKEFDFEVI